jgi:hypothetical protein
LRVHKRIFLGCWRKAISWVVGEKLFKKATKAESWKQPWPLCLEELAWRGKVLLTGDDRLGGKSHGHDEKVNARNVHRNEPW